MFRESPIEIAWGAAFTLLVLTACVTDVRARRIPNVLVAVLAAGGLIYSISTFSLVTGLIHAGSGLLLGFVIWIVFHVAGVIGAGDVKFFSAVGAWLGPALTWRAALVAAAAGGVLAVFVLIREKRFASTLRRLGLAASSGSLSILGDAAADRSEKRHQLPYGVALAIGALAAAWVPRLLP